MYGTMNCKEWSNKALKSQIKNPVATHSSCCHFPRATSGFPPVTISPGVFLHELKESKVKRTPKVCWDHWLKLNFRTLAYTAHANFDLTQKHHRGDGGVWVPEADQPDTHLPWDSPTVNAGPQNTCRSKATLERTQHLKFKWLEWNVSLTLKR